MVSVLVDNWLYINIDGKSGVYGKQEAQRTLNTKMKHVSAAFLDYQTKVISLTNRDSNYMDQMINESFDQGYLIVKEKLSSEFEQIIAVKKEKIEEVYRDLQGVQVSNLVPYGLAIRAVLTFKSLLDKYPYIIFLDDLGNQSVLTFFEGMKFSSSRRINMLDTSYIHSEIKRSWKSFLLEQPNKTQPEDNSFCLVSNNKQWLSDLVTQGFVRKEQIIYLDEAYPALLGLTQAKFTVHFALAEEILKQKKNQLLKSRMKAIAVAFVLIITGCGLYVTSSFFLNKERHEAEYLSVKKEEKDNQLRQLNQSKFLSLMDTKDTFNYQKIYFDFISAIPENYLIDSFKLTRISDELWSLEALIYPMSDSIIPSDFNGGRFYTQTSVTHVLTHKVLGQLINCTLSLKEA